MEDKSYKVRTLEAIKGGGGSVKVGTTGKVSDLMSRELNSLKTFPQTSMSSRKRCPTARIQNSITSLGESSTSCNNNINRKAKHNPRKTHQIPMLNSDNVSLDGSPSRRKPNKKGPYLADIVDIKCGNPDITSRLKKLGFSKLSQTFA